MAIETPARIAVLGAGPIGLEAALYARYLGYDVDVYERGRVAEHVLRWGHVRLFSPFGANRSPLGLAALRAQDPAWQAPGDDALLSGREFAQRYLLPLAHSDLLADSVHEHCEVVAIGRDGPLKGQWVEGDLRADCDFRLLVRSTRGEPPHERVVTADAVIDATGTLGCHNWLGPGGIPAIGELAAQGHVEYGLPDVLGGERANYAGRNVLLVGDGLTAATNLVALAELAAQTPDTWITWATRARPEAAESPVAGGPVAVAADDPLSERRRMANLANRLAVDDANHVSHLAQTSVEAISWHTDLERFAVTLSGRHGGEMEFDRVIANVGYRPDTSLFGELHVDLSGTSAAAHGSHGGLVLREPDFYVLGAKSYGRDCGFLMADGFAQIRQLFAILGDRPELDVYASMAALASQAPSAG